MKKQKTWLGVVCVIAASVIWGSTGLFVRNLNDVGFANIDKVETRALIGSLVTGIFLLIKDPAQLKIRLKDAWCFLGTGIMNMLLCGICNYYCIQNSSLAIAGAMIQTGPMFALIFGGLIFKEKITPRKVVAIILTFTGCVMASGLSGSERLTPLGFLFGIGSGIAYSMYSVFSRAAINRGYESTTITFYSFLFCAIGSAAFANWANMAQAVVAVPSTLLWALGFGIINGCGGYVLYTKGLQNIETGKASILCSLELVTNVMIGLLVYHEVLNPAIGIGLILIFTGIIISSLAPKAEKLPG